LTQGFQVGVSLSNLPLGQVNALLELRIVKIGDAGLNGVIEPIKS
jgi:uncharacterized protein (DUF3820 family)